MQDTLSPRADARYDGVRAAAMQILFRVEQDASYANLLLSEAASGMAARDAAFCTTLTLGTLRRRGQLDWVLNGYLRSPITNTQPVVRQILRLGAFQILHLDVRKAAAVDESVKLAKAYAGIGPSKLVNAVLRKVDPTATAKNLSHLKVASPKTWSIATGLPDWYVEEARSTFDTDTALGACLAAVNEPPLTIRTNTTAGTTGALRQALKDHGIGSAPHPIVPDVLTVYCPAPILTASPPFRDGLCRVQDGSAVLAALALETQPGDTVADLCAAPGGKTGILAAQAGENGRVLAVERDERRLAMVDTLIAREGFHNTTLLQTDATQSHTALQRGTFDRVLVDAPCSAIGIARHRPDMLWREAPRIDDELAPTQRALLANGLDLLKPNGVLVYSVCSFLAAEGRAVVDAVIGDMPQIQPDPLPESLGRWTGAPEHAIIPPGDCGLDGFTILRLRRTS